MSAPRARNRATDIRSRCTSSINSKKPVMRNRSLCGSFRADEPHERLPCLAHVRLQLRIRPAQGLRHEAVALDRLVPLAQPLGDATTLQRRQNKPRARAVRTPARTFQQGAGPAVITPRGEEPSEREIQVEASGGASQAQRVGYRFQVPQCPGGIAAGEGGIGGGRRAEQPGSKDEERRVGPAGLL